MAVATTTDMVAERLRPRQFQQFHWRQGQHMPCATWPAMQDLGGRQLGWTVLGRWRGRVGSFVCMVCVSGGGSVVGVSATVRTGVGEVGIGIARVCFCRCGGGSAWRQALHPMSVVEVVQNYDDVDGG